MNSDVDLLTKKGSRESPVFFRTPYRYGPQKWCAGWSGWELRFPTRLSFMRLLLRRMKEEMWKIQRVRFDLDDCGLWSRGL